MEDSKECGKPARREIRNVGIIAHIDAGKTSLTEKILQRTGTIRYAGEVSEGTTVTDWLPQERERGISIISAAVTCHWADVQINLIDTPGHVDFTAEVERTLEVLDGVVAVFCGVHGVQAQSETVWRRAQRHGIPAIAFINKLDRIGANFQRVVSDIEARLGIVAVPMQVPIDNEDGFRGMADVVTGQFMDEDGNVIEDMSGDERVWFAKESLLETLSNMDDGILEALLEDKKPGIDQIRQSLREAVRNRRIVPVFGGSARLGLGVRQLLDAVRDYLPSPDAFEKDIVQDGRAKHLLVFKVQREPHDTMTQICAKVYGGRFLPGDSLWNARTKQWQTIGGIYRMFAGTCEPLDEAEAGDIVMLGGLDGDLATGDMLYSVPQTVTPVALCFPEPVVSVVMEGIRGAQPTEVREALAMLCLADPTLQVHEGPLAGQWTLKGMGELHLEIVRERLETEFGLAVAYGKPQVTYRKTVNSTGHGECLFEKRLPKGEILRAGISLKLEPLERGKGVEIDFGAAARGVAESTGEFLELHLRQLAREGLGDDKPLADLRIVLERISCFEGETTEPVLMTACRKAMADALEAGNAVTLEPVMAVEIAVPEEYVGKLLDDLMARRGRVTEVNSVGDGQARIISLVPLGELFGYANALRSLSCGRGDFVAEPSLYVPLVSC
ncbi:MAG: GTP-binding protein [Victivallales bacterium]|nr:GTP-binding protein [Victivallales bacterium]